ncbi:unnamed protein product [Notodromas monacha]|uniref:Uncharacterized protein n=1 Tax=Notodromas monacha TaxID=399045 RepID=A0A7R9BE68_9CRUS|nr:unnamed protein product [Notodromas monacha]CAG0913017.1 unnamed protein product [Notodromas monacha]
MSVEVAQPIFQSMSRVGQLPVVAAVFGSVQRGYERVKQSPVPLVGSTLNAAEASAKYAVATVSPVAMKFQRPIGFVDSIACKGLDVIEARLPLVKKEPEQIIADAKAVISGTVSAPVNMAKQMTSYGKNKAGEVADYSQVKLIQAVKTKYAQVALQNLDSMLNLVDTYVDKLIPPQEKDEKLPTRELEEKVDPALVPLVHAAALTDKIRHRLYVKTVNTADYLHITDLAKAVTAQMQSGSQAIVDATNRVMKETSNITPGNAAQLITSGIDYIESQANACVSVRELRKSPEIMRNLVGAILLSTALNLVVSYPEIISVEEDYGDLTRTPNFTDYGDVPPFSFRSLFKDNTSNKSEIVKILRATIFPAGGNETTEAAAEMKIPAEDSMMKEEEDPSMSVTTKGDEMDEETVPRSDDMDAEETEDEEAEEEKESGSVRIRRSAGYNSGIQSSSSSGSGWDSGHAVSHQPIYVRSHGGYGRSKKGIGHKRKSKVVVQHVTSYEPVVHHKPVIALKRVVKHKPVIKLQRVVSYKPVHKKIIRPAPQQPSYGW